MLKLAPNFFLAGTTEAELMHGIQSRSVHNEHLSFQQFCQWMQKPDTINYESLDEQQVDAVLEVLRKQLPDDVAIAKSHSVSSYGCHSEAASQNFDILMEFLVKNVHNHRFVVTMLLQKNIWYLYIMDTHKHSAIWAESSNSQSTPPNQLASFHLDVQAHCDYPSNERMRKVEIPSHLDESASGLMALATILAFFAQPFSEPMLLPFDGNTAEILRERLPACVARQSFLDIQINTFDLVDFSIAFFPNFLDDFDPVYDYVNRPVELPPPSVHLKNCAQFVNDFPFVSPLQRVVCAVGFLTSNGRHAPTRLVVAFLMQRCHLTEADILPVLVGTEYTEGNQAEMPMATRPIVRGSRSWHLTEFGFETYIKGVAALLRETSRGMEPMLVFSKSKGRPVSEDLRPYVVLDECNQPMLVQPKSNHRPSWISVLWDVFMRARRPLTVKEIVQWIMEHPEMNIDTKHRSNANSLRASVRQALTHGTKPSPTFTNEAGMRASRPAIFYCKIFDNNVMTGGLLSDIHLTHRVPHRPSSLLQWRQVDPDESMCQAWVLPLVHQAQAFGVNPYRNSVVTYIPLPPGTLIEYSDSDDWPLRSAEEGIGIEMVRYGTIWYAEVKVHYTYNPGDTVNFNPIRNE